MRVLGVDTRKPIYWRLIPHRVLKFLSLTSQLRSERYQSYQTSKFGLAYHGMVLYILTLIVRLEAIVLVAILVWLEMPLLCCTLSMVLTTFANGPMTLTFGDIPLGLTHLANSYIRTMK